MGSRFRTFKLKNKWVRVLAQKLISEFRKLRSKEYHTLSSTKISGFYRDFIKITHIYCYSLGCAFRVNPGQFWAEQIRVSWRSPWPKIFEKIKKVCLALINNEIVLLGSLAATRVSALKGLLRVLVDTCHKLKQSMFHLWYPVTLVYPSQNLKNRVRLISQPQK